MKSSSNTPPNLLQQSSRPPQFQTHLAIPLRAHQFLLNHITVRTAIVTHEPAMSRLNNPESAHTTNTQVKPSSRMANPAPLSLRKWGREHARESIYLEVSTHQQPFSRHLFTHFHSAPF